MGPKGMWLLGSPKAPKELRPRARLRRGRGHLIDIGRQGHLLCASSSGGLLKA